MPKSVFVNSLRKASSNVSKEKHHTYDFTNITFQKSQLIDRIRHHGLLTIEVDQRHIDLMNEMVIVGFLSGIQHAKQCVDWRINGQFWSDMIDKGEYDAS